jgi:hypothetical protein
MKNASTDVHSSVLALLNVACLPKHTGSDVRSKPVTRSKADVSRLRDVSDVLDDLGAL